MASVEKRRDTKGRVHWYARYRDPDGRQRSRSFDRKGAAETFLATVTVDTLTGSYVDPDAGRITLEAFYAVHAARQQWAPTTRELVDQAVRSTPFYRTPLGRITPGAVEAWVKASSVRLAPGTVRTRLAYLRGVLRAAVRDRLIARDPSEGVQAPREPSRRSGMVIPTPGQVGAVLDAAGPRDRAVYALAAFAGLRAGEITGLRVRDVDFLGRVVRVRQQGRNGTLAPPKSRASERDVPVPDELLAILAEHVRRWPTSSGLLIREQVLSRGSLGTGWRRTCRRAGVGGVRLHDLRHFYASGLIAAGCDVVTVQRALGHESASTTLDTYAHLFPDASDRTRAAASALAGAVLDQDRSTQRVHTSTETGG